MNAVVNVGGATIFVMDVDRFEDLIALYNLKAIYKYLRRTKCICPSSFM